jgi:hypothetical protein
MQGLEYLGVLFLSMFISKRTKLNFSAVRCVSLWTIFLTKEDSNVFILSVRKFLFLKVSPFAKLYPT